MARKKKIYAALKEFLYILENRKIKLISYHCDNSLVSHFEIKNI